MGVADTDISIQAISWDDCNRVTPLPKPSPPCPNWGRAVEAAGKAARKEIWISGDNSQEKVRQACDEALKARDPEGGEDDFRGLMTWHAPLSLGLPKDVTVRYLPSLEGVEEIVALLNAWWPDHWERQDKADIDRALSHTEASIDFELAERDNPADALLAKLLWLEQLRRRFPGRPVTLGELAQKRHRRLVFEIAEKHAAGLSDASTLEFFDLVDAFANEKLKVPVDSDSVQEAVFTRSLITVGLCEIDRCRVAAALLQTAADVNSETCLQPNKAMHPIHGYTLIFGDSATGNHQTLVGAAPGCWRLQIEGEQHVLTCELWPRPVVMSHQEYGRARGSANAILRDVGVAVDSPPGHWKKIWETFGLRSQLLLAAQRVDPRTRLEQVFRWVQKIASTAPTAHRPPTDGSAVRLSDGKTVVDVRWLVEKALADGMIMPHERDRLEREIRSRSIQTNRRDAAKKQRKLLVIDAGPAASENPLISDDSSGTLNNSVDG